MSTEIINNYYFVPDTEDQDKVENARERGFRLVLEKGYQQDEVEAKRQEMERWWEENKNQVESLKRPKPTEKEMVEEFKKFLQMVRADRAEKIRRAKEFRAYQELKVCEWYDEHEKETKITPHQTLEEQYEIFLGESKKIRDAKEAEERKKRRMEAAKRFAQIEADRRAVGKKRAQQKQSAPNAKGKDQGRDKVNAEREAKKKQLAEEKTKKENGEESVYMGKRATHRAKKEAQVIKIVPRETVFKQEFVIEDEHDEDEESEVEEEYVSYKILEKSQIELPKPTPKVVHQEKKAPKEDEWTQVSKKGKKPTTPIQVGTSLIQQKKDERAKTDPKFAKRQQAYKDFSDKKSNEKNLTRTRLCRSVIEGTRCPHGARCRFAHSVSEMTKPNCHFGTGCRLVRTNGQKYVNNKGDKVCQFAHPGETDENYGERMGVKTSHQNKHQCKPQTRKPTKIRTIRVKKELLAQTRKMVAEKGLKVKIETY